MTEPFDKHDAEIRRIVTNLTRRIVAGWPTATAEPPEDLTTMGKMTSESIKLLEMALAEWRDTCPGAGWEHHQTSALVTLAMTPGMQKLLELAAIGIAVKQAEDQRHTRT